MLVLGDPQRAKSLSGARRLVPSRRPRGCRRAEFLYAADGQLWRRGIAAQTRQPGPLVRRARRRDTPAARRTCRTLDELGPPARARDRGCSIDVADGRRSAFTALGDFGCSSAGSCAGSPTIPSSISTRPSLRTGNRSCIASERSGQFELWRVPTFATALPSASDVRRAAAAPPRRQRRRPARRVPRDGRARAAVARPA